MPGASAEPLWYLGCSSCFFALVFVNAVCIISSKGGRWVFSELSPVAHPTLLGRMKVDVHFLG